MTSASRNTGIQSARPLRPLATEDDALGAAVVTPLAERRMHMGFTLAACLALQLSPIPVAARLPAPEAISAPTLDAILGNPQGRLAVGIAAPTGPVPVPLAQPGLNGWAEMVWPDDVPNPGADLLADLSAPTFGLAGRIEVDVDGLGGAVRSLHWVAAPTQSRLDIMEQDASVALPETALAESAGGSADGHVVLMAKVEAVDPLAPLIAMARPSRDPGPDVGREAVLPQAERPEVRFSGSVREQQRRLVDHVVGKWRGVSRPDAEHFVGEAWSVATKKGVDPVLVVAVMAIESSFNPKARSHVGAEGLMQVHVPVHRDKFRKFGGRRAVTNPRANIEVGVDILRSYLKRYGTERAALKAYVGAARMRSDGGYGKKVLTQRDRFAAVIEAGKPTLARNGGRPARNAIAAE